MRKGKYKGEPIEGKLISDMYQVMIQVDKDCAPFPLPINEVYFTSEGVKEVMASEHIQTIMRKHDSCFVESGFGDYVFAFKERKHTFSSKRRKSYGR